MAPAPLGTLVGYVRRWLGPRPAGEPSDGQLLERFLDTRDAAAFTALLERHGPMVLGVCRRVLDDPNDADDAFQATFLVLVQRATGIGKRESVGSWLHGVAYRIAQKARVQAARRRKHENQAMTPLTTPPSDEFMWRELRPVLDEELSRLPEKYRAPLVLCYLEGKSQDEAARALGWTKGTLSGRMAQARDLLRNRLSRRGVTLTAGGLALLTAGKLSAAVPAGLSAATSQAAVTFTTSGAIAAPVAALMKGAVPTMLFGKLKTAAVVVVATGLLAGGGVLLAPFTGLLGDDDDDNEPLARPAPREVKGNAVWQLVSSVPTPEKYTTCLAFTPDGRGLLVAGGSSQAGDAKVWNVGGPAPREQFALRGYPKAITDAVFTPDGKTLVASSSWDGTTKLWDVATGKERTTLPMKVGLPAGALSADGKTLAVRAQSDLKFLDLTAPGFPVKSLVKAPASKYSPQAISADRKRAAYLVFGADGMISVSVRDLASGREIARPEAVQYLHAPRFSPDGKRLAVRGQQVGDNSGGILLWDAATGQIIVHLRDASDNGSLVELARPGGGPGGGQVLVKGINSPGVFSPDGELLAMGTMGGAVYFWDVASGTNRGTIQAHAAAVELVAFAPDGKRLATAGRDGKVRLWQRTSAAYPAPAPDEDAPKPADVYLLRARVQVKHTDLVKAPTDVLSSVAFAPDGKSFVAANQNQLVRLWKFEGGKAREWATLDNFQFYVIAIAYSPDGKLLASADGTPNEPAELKLWDLTGDVPKERAAWRGHRTSVECLTFTPDGSTLITGDDDGTVKLWDVATARETASLQAHRMPVHGVAISPDGKLLATASQDHTAKIWDLARGRARRMLRGHKSFVLSVAFSPDGKSLVTGSQDQNAKVWDVASGKRRATLRGNNNIEAVAFSPDGRSVVTGSMAGPVCWWDTAKYGLQASLMLPNQRVRRLALSADGQYIAAGMMDGTVAVWEIKASGGKQ